MLLNIRRDLPSPGSYDALLIAEAPMNLAALKSITDKIPMSVVYKPPTWKNHAEQVVFTSPSAELCGRLVGLIEANIGRHDYDSVCEILGVNPREVAALTNTQIIEAIGIPNTYLPLMRRTVFRGHTTRISKLVRLAHLLVLRIEPESADLMKAYEFIKQCPRVGNMHVLENNSLAKVAKFWRSTLKMLIRDGAIESRGQIGMYSLTGVVPNYGRIQALHEHARADVETMTAYVDALPDYLTSGTRSL
jgi:hypothetical protein